MTAEAAGRDTLEWGDDRLVLAVAFGLASIPWTYGFVVGLRLPLWPSFVASASFFAAGGGVEGLRRGYVANVTGIAYAAGTLLVGTAVSGGPVALAVVVGLAMFVASVQQFLPGLGFTPGAFLGYATLFGVHASGATMPVGGGLAGEVTAAVVAMFLGACIGLGVEKVSLRLSQAEAAS